MKPPKNAAAVELDNSTAKTKTLITGQANETNGSTLPCPIACSPAACVCPFASPEAAELAHTRAMLLAPPEVPALAAVWAWGHRLRHGVETRTITHREANEAWRRVIAKLGVTTNGLDT